MTGARVATEEQANLAQRRRVLEQCDTADGRRRVLAVCARSFPVWCGLWAWTQVYHEHTDAGRVERRGAGRRPLILWPVQAAAIADLETCLPAGRSLLWAKSRDMGATWIALAWTLHRLLFTKGFSALWLTRKANLVDERGNPDSLFERIRFMAAHLPLWMPQIVQPRLMHIEVPATGSVLDGESTDRETGRQSRRDFIGIDEAAAIEQLRAIDAGTSATARCRLFISTSKRGSYFAILRRSGKLHVSTFPWHAHPKMGRGRELIADRDGRSVITSPWYRAEVAKMVDPQAVAEELDMDEDAGSGVFDGRVLDAHAAAYGEPPQRGVLRWTGAEAALPPNQRRGLPAWAPDARGLGPWRWFPRAGPLTPQRRAPDQPPVIRPNQRHDFVFGVDVSMGLGASDSIIAAYDADTGAKVARFTSNRVTPEQLADELYDAGRWFGGKRGWPLLVIESNGPGQACLLRLRALGYPRLYRHQDRTQTVPMLATTYGWASTLESKRTALEQYRSALGRHELHNGDLESLEQCRAYVYYESGGVGPIALGQLSAEQRKQHGDMVIADMLASLGLRRMRLGETPLGSERS